MQVLTLDKEILDGGADLPGHFQNKLCAIHFISHVLAAAQEAQKTYGVPASVLIANAMHACGWGRDPALGEGDHFGRLAQQRRRPYTPRETKLDFLREAKRISRHPKYRLASRFIDCRCKYAAQLCHYGIISGQGTYVNSPAWNYANDIIDQIVRHELWNCDIPESVMTLEKYQEQEHRERAFEENFDKCRTPAGDISMLPPGEIVAMPHLQLVC